jgi:hypothetical protein
MHTHIFNISYVIYKPSQGNEDSKNGTTLMLFILGQTKKGSSGIVNEICVGKG